MTLKKPRIKIKIPDAYTPAERKAIAIDIIREIVKRTQSGKNIQGDDWPGKAREYTMGYKNSVDFKNAGKGSLVDLTATGDMLAELDVLKTKKGEVEIGYKKGAENYGKAEGNINGTYGRKLSSPTSKARDFLGINFEDKMDILKKYPTAKTKRDKSKERATIVNEIVNKAAKNGGTLQVVKELEDEFE